MGLKNPPYMASVVGGGVVAAAAADNIGVDFDKVPSSSRFDDVVVVAVGASFVVAASRPFVHLLVVLCCWT